MKRFDELNEIEKKEKNKIAIKNIFSKRNILIFGICLICAVVLAFIWTYIYINSQKSRLQKIQADSVNANQNYSISFDWGNTTSSTTKVETQSEEKVEEPKPVQQVERYKLGDVVKVETENGSYEITFTGVEETDFRNQFSDRQVDRVVLINYQYKNIDFSQTRYDGSIDNEISIDSWDLKVYDSEGNILDTYPATTERGSGVTPGHKGKGTIAYGLNDANNYLEIEYSASLLDSTTCVFDVEW